MANKSIFQRSWVKIDRLVRNTIDLRQWPGIRPWNKQSTPLSSAEEFNLVEMQPREYYVGQLYGAIRTRANRVAALAKEHTKTRIFDDPEAEIDEQHPYLKLINESPSFPNTFFWRAMSTFLDLTGTAYIFVLRNPGNGSILGEPQEFKIVNPYNLTKYVKGSNPDEYTYIETRGAAWREIPKEQLIIIRSFNPFNLEEGYAMVEAAKDDQFSIQQARNYTRTAVKDNVGQRGMLAPEQVLSDEDYTNFQNAIADKGKGGKFFTSNAPVKYSDMQIDLDKLALDKINTISVETLVMVTGASKTLLGVEQSQISQEQAKVQRELFTENHAIPQLDDILDPLNQDYKNNYKSDYESNRIEMFVDSPLKVDKDLDLKDAQIEKVKAETAKTFIDAGYEPDSVNKYLDIDDELKFEERQPKGLPLPPGQFTPDEEDEEAKELKQALNRFSPGLEQVVRGHEATLANQITNIEGQVLQAALPKLSEKFAKNQLTESDRMVNEAERKRLERDLALALSAFGGAIVALFANQTINRRFAQFKLPAQFVMTDKVNKTIRDRSSRAASSHMHTFLKDIYQSARDASIEGLGRDAIISRLTADFQDIAKTDATRIARTESYKAVNLAQFEADKQFLEQNNLEGVKKWVVQSDNPCSYCQELEGTEVPFDRDFLSIGDSVKAEFSGENGSSTREYVVGVAKV